LQIREIPPPDAPLELLLEADPALEKINEYLPRSRCFVAFLDDRPAGAYVVMPIAPGVYELMNIAVAPEAQQKGVGSKLLAHAIAAVRELGARRLELGTGAFGYQLAFYQRAGFRVVAVERDYFLKNYAAPLYENGIRHRDRLKLALDY
jgi:ribosomal protein S18 acetylase RimI-like enzyme